MFKHFAKLTLGSLLLLSSISSSLAETVSFEGLSTMPLSNAIEQDTVSYLAYIDSQKKASQEALKYLKQQNFFKQGQIDSQYYSALVRILSIDTLTFSPSSSNPNEIQFKTKFKYDSFEFPENLKSYFHENILSFSLFQYEIKREQEFEAQVRQFLKKINNTQDEEYRKFLQETEGTKISNYVKASQMVDLAYKYKAKEEFDKA